MKTRTKLFSVRPRAAIGAVVASAVMLVSVGFSSPSGANTIKTAGESAFCSTVFTFHPKTPPTLTSLTAYKAWAKSLEPFYQKLASEAPNAGSKTVLNAVVTVLKDYLSSSSLSKLDSYVLKNKAAWTKGTKALAAAIISCAKSL